MFGKLRMSPGWKIGSGMKDAGMKDARKSVSSFVTIAALLFIVKVMFLRL